MRDPNPSNITGEKVQRHVFKHSINWGYVAIAVAAVVVVLKLLPPSDSEGQEPSHSPGNGGVTQDSRFAGESGT